MSFAQGIDFRSTAAFVTDPTNCTSEIGTTANYPRTTPQGNNVGWEDAPAGTRNRTATVDARLAGIAFAANGASPKRYRIDLPAAGWYRITLAIGDNTTAESQSVTVLDGTTVVSYVVGQAVPTPAAKFFDACGVLRSSASDWVTNEVSFVAFFSTTICRVKIGDGGASGNSSIAHVKVEDATAPSPSFPAGIDFRSTGDFVSDPSGSSPELATFADYPHITAEGLTVGWEQAPSGKNNRSSSVDARLAGEHSVAAGTQSNFRIDLPRAGVYRLRLAIGDATTAQPAGVGVAQTVELFDGSTSLGTIVSNGVTAVQQFYDATGVLRTSAADWVTNEAELETTFGTTILRLKCGIAAGGTASTTIAHARVDQVPDLGVPFIGSNTVVRAPSIVGDLAVPFIGSVTSLHAPTLVGNVQVTFIASVTAVYAPTLAAISSEVDVPFIASVTALHAPGLPIQVASGELVLAADDATVYFIMTTPESSLILKADAPTQPGIIEVSSGALKLLADNLRAAGATQLPPGSLRLLADPPRFTIGSKPVSGKLLLKADAPTVYPVTPPSGTIIVKADAPIIAGLISPTGGRLRLAGDPPTVYPVVVQNSGKLLLLADPPAHFGADALRLPNSGILRLKADTPTIPNLKEPGPPPPPQTALGISGGAVIS